MPNTATDLAPSANPLAATPRFLQSFTVGADRMDAMRAAVVEENAAAISFNNVPMDAEHVADMESAGLRLRRARINLCCLAADVARYATEAK